MGIFKKNVKDTEMSVAPGFTEEEKVIETPEAEVEEWIWVDGYKATERDMTCRGYQYELLKAHNISEDKPVEMCEHGFHLCKTLNDVTFFYDIGEGHRFFEVKALVRKQDFDNYGKGSFSYAMRPDGRMVPVRGDVKLVARSIVFVRELTPDEILSNYIDPNEFKEWTEEMKKDALETSISNARTNSRINRLASLGYSETFAKTIVDAGKYDIAYSVGTQDGLSMDMKVWTIYNHK